MRADDQDVVRSKDNHFRLSFLGPEFLTWLYFHIHQIGGEIRLSELLPKKSMAHDVLRIAVGKRMILKPLTPNEIQVSVSGPMLDDSGEVLQAIRAGAYVDSLSIELVIGERHHSLTLFADGAISNAKTQQLFEIKDNDTESWLDGEKSVENNKKKWSDEESLLLRMSSLDEIEDLVQALFARFLSRRLGQAFVSGDISIIRQTVAEGLKAKLPMAENNKNQEVYAEP